MRYALFGDTLATVARGEVERRVKYLGKHLAGMPEPDRNAAVVNFQAWSAIADWLAHGFTRLVHLYGGIESDTWIDWTTLEEAAAKELKALETKLEAGSRGEQEEAGQASEARAELQRRRDCLVCIHAAVSNWRATLEDTGAEIRAAIAEKVAA